MGKKHCKSLIPSGGRGLVTHASPSCLLGLSNGGGAGWQSQQGTGLQRNGLGTLHLGKDVEDRGENNCATD